MPPFTHDDTELNSLRSKLHSISLFHMDCHCNSKTRHGWACAAEMFQSTATAPEASLHLPWMSSYCHVNLCNSYRGGASCQGWTFHHFPVNSKICCEWTKWCLWRCCAAMKRLRSCFGITMATRVKKANWALPGYCTTPAIPAAWNFHFSSQLPTLHLNLH